MLCACTISSTFYSHKYFIHIMQVSSVFLAFSDWHQYLHWSLFRYSNWQAIVTQQSLIHLSTCFWILVPTTY